MKRRGKAKIIATRLTEAEYALFAEAREASGETTDYGFMRTLIRNAAETKAADKTDAPVMEGDFEADIKRAEAKPVTTLQKVLGEMTGGKKSVDSVVKRHAAYHDENTLIDIMNMIKFGRPTLLEIRWICNYAYARAVIAEALVRKGAADDIAREILRDIKWRPAMRHINPREMERRNPRADDTGRVMRD